MIEKALKYIVGLKGGFQIVEQKGRTYLFDNNGNPMREFVKDYQSKLETSTLSSIVDYFAGDPDKVFTNGKNFIIRVGGIDKVDLMSEVSDEMLRDEFLHVRSDLPNEFPFGSYMDLETFNVMLQSRFLDTEDRAKLLALTANVVDESVSTYGDDGTSQKTTVKSGVTSVAEVKVPNPVTLKPFRTFAEAEQPESKFVFRMRKNEDGVTAALIEADGGAWKVQAIRNIAEYLENCLEEKLTAEQMARITILA